MAETKESILQSALHLFAQEGYEAVSVSAIAGALGMTKGALYRHYASKRDIFDHIVARMAERDAQRAQAFSLPEGVRAQTPEAYAAASLEQIIAYAGAQLRYWAEDDFAAAFRRLLTLEQYRSAEMMRLYQQYLAAGPLSYVADLFESIGLPCPRERAAAFYAPLFLLLSVYDGAAEPQAVLAQMDSFLAHAREELRKSLPPRPITP